MKLKYKLIDDDTIRIWKDSIGLFAIVDFKDAYNEIQAAKGRLENISDSGKITIRHLKNPDIVWIFDIQQVVNSKFSPIR